MALIYDLPAIKMSEEHMVSIIQSIAAKPYYETRHLVYHGMFFFTATLTKVNSYPSSCGDILRSAAISSGLSVSHTVRASKHSYSLSVLPSFTSASFHFRIPNY
ncbi:MAG: hypothetical protein ABSA01_12600 [Anaerolineales bacterium]|jgi:hypothetical protein